MFWNTFHTKTAIGTTLPIAHASPNRRASSVRVATLVTGRSASPNISKVNPGSAPSLVDPRDWWISAALGEVSVSYSTGWGPPERPGQSAPPGTLWD